MLVLRTVFTGVFVPVFTLTALGVLDRLGRRFMVNGAIAHFTKNRLGRRHPVPYEKKESDERTPTHQPMPVCEEFRHVQ